LNWVGRDGRTSSAPRQAERLDDCLGIRQIGKDRVGLRRHEIFYPVAACFHADGTDANFASSRHVQRHIANNHYSIRVEIIEFILGIRNAIQPQGTNKDRLLGPAKRREPVPARSCAAPTALRRGRWRLAMAGWALCVAMN